MTAIRVFIADDHTLLRSGLRLLIESQEDMQVVGEAGHLGTVKHELEIAQPDVLTLDITMPGAAGMSGITALRRALPELRILVVTMHDDPAYVRTALALGAMGYVVKSAADVELITAIRAVYQGRIFIDAHYAPPLPGESDISVGSQFEKLSVREKEVLALVAQGHTNQAAADRLGLSVKTIETYRARLMDKLNLSCRADLIRVAIESGLLVSDTAKPIS